METTVYYFSGRGNSLSVAKGLAQRMGSTRIKPLAAEKGEVTVKGGRLGIVLPVIDFGLPIAVRKFVGRLRCAGDKPYVFAVVTCGGMPGASLQELARLLKKRGLKLSMGEYIQFGSAQMTEDEWKSRMDTIAADVMQKKMLPLPKATLSHRLMTGLANPLARLMIPGEDRKFRVSESCSGCGTCERICPVGNIRLTNGNPEWLHHCEQCAACFSWCPQEAISGKCLAAKTHYKNPRIREEEMLGE